MKCGHPLSISVIAFITKMSNRGASHFISCSGNHWRNPRTGKKKKKPSDRPQLTQVKSSISRCLSASFCGIKSWEAFWPTGAQAGVGEVVWSTGVQAEVGEGGLAHRDVGWGGGSGLAHRDTGWNGGSGLTHKGAGWGVFYWRFLAFRSMELYKLQLLVASFWAIWLPQRLPQRWAPICTLLLWVLARGHSWVL